VDRAGVVVLEPVTVPMVGLMDREVALATVQDRVEVPFKATTEGEAVKEEMTGRDVPAEKNEAITATRLALTAIPVHVGFTAEAVD
jgi:hypothetical protein